MKEHTGVKKLPEISLAIAALLLFGVTNLQADDFDLADDSTYIEEQLELEDQEEGWEQVYADEFEYSEDESLNDEFIAADSAARAQWHDVPETAADESRGEIDILSDEIFADTLRSGSGWTGGFKN